MTDASTGSRSLAGRFARDRGGAVAIIFGLLLLPLIGAIGLAIDFGQVMTARTKAQMAADAAALQAAGVARDLLKDSDGGAAATATAISNAQTRAKSLFDAHAVQSGLKDYTVTIKVVRDGQSITSSADFTLVSANSLGKVFGYDTFSARGNATSAASLPNYSDVYLALDISGSMGIAATQAEMVKLYNAKGNKAGGKTEQTGCVFGCHTIETSAGWTESFSNVASRLGIKLRIDVLRDAVIDMIATAQSDADAAPIYRLALYTMGASVDASTWSLNPLATLTNNFTQLTNSAKTIDIATPPPTAPQKQNSYINEQLNSLVSAVPTSYDGSSQAKSKKYVFIITDGARDAPPSFGSCTTPAGSGRCTNPINPTYCKAFKDKGITVGVLNTTYVPIPDDPNKTFSWTTNVNYWFKLEVVDNNANPNTGKVYAGIQPALQACASDGWYFEASDDVGIKAAMAKMFSQTTAAPSLIN